MLIDVARWKNKNTRWNWFKIGWILKIELHVNTATRWFKWDSWHCIVLLCRFWNSSKQMELHSTQFLRSNKPKLVNSLTKVDDERIINPFKSVYYWIHPSDLFWSIDRVLIFQFRFFIWGLGPSELRLIPLLRVTLCKT